MTEPQPRAVATPTSPRGPRTPLGVLLSELWRYKLVIPAVAAIVTAAVSFWIMRQPKVYEASATFEYDANPVQPLGRAVEDSSSLQGSFWETQEFYETQNYILRSRSLAERVVRKLSLDRDRDFVRRFGAAPPTTAAMANALLEALTISQVRDTRVVRLSIRDQNADRAQLITNTWVESYIEKSLEDRLGTSGRALEWLSDQMRNLKRDLESSELALYKFREENHSLSASLDERRKIIAGQLASYSNAFTEIHARRIQTESKLTVLQETLLGSPDLLFINSGPLGSSETIEKLRSTYRDADERLRKLAVTYGSAHPEVRSAEASRVASLTQLRSQVAAIAQGVASEVRELTLAEKGIQAALEQVNQQGLALSLQEIDYSRLDRERSSKANLYDLVLDRIAQTDLTRALKVANGRLIDSALKPQVAVSPRVRVWIAGGVLIGLVMGILAALGVSFLDNKVRGPADIETRGVTVLGVLPALSGDIALNSYSKSRRKQGRRIENKERDLIVHLEPRSTTAECCRTIRTNITFQSADHPLRTIAITSAMPKDGKTTVSISIATTLAQSGRRILIVDTDLRKPRLHRAFQLPSHAGVTSILAGETLLDDTVQTTDIPNVTLLQCGPLPPNPSELLHTRRFAELIEEARSKFDIVIFDTPPLGAVTDPAVISTQVDGTILVVRSRTTTRSGVDAALRQLRGVSARILGVVLNGVSLTDSDYDSYYAYYRGYYAEDSPPPTKGSASSTT
jgi:capsular exopolysaccharide synthesis family protein